MKNTLIKLLLLTLVGSALSVILMLCGAGFFIMPLCFVTAELITSSPFGICLLGTFIYWLTCISVATILIMSSSRLRRELTMATNNL